MATFRSRGTFLDQQESVSRLIIVQKIWTWNKYSLSISCLNVEYKRSLRWSCLSALEKPVFRGWGRGERILVRVFWGTKLLLQTAKNAINSNREAIRRPGPLHGGAAGTCDNDAVSVQCVWKRLSIRSYKGTSATCGDFIESRCFEL